MRCDVVLAMTDPPFEGIVGAFVAMLKRKPFVYNIRDLYPDMALGGSIVAPGLLARVWEMLHRWALRRATRVIVLGEDMKARIVAKGVTCRTRGHRARWRRNRCRPGSSAAPELDSEVISAIRSDFRFVLLHAGNLGFYGAWETLLAAARELEGDGVGLVFVGDGAQRARLEAGCGPLDKRSVSPFFPAEQDCVGACRG